MIAAGLAAIPRETLEAARVDGANEWQVFRRITVPLLRPVLVVVFVTLVINVLKIFDLVLVIAPGSSQRDANVIALEMWRVVVRRPRPGWAARWRCSCCCWCCRRWLQHPAVPGGAT